MDEDLDVMSREQLMAVVVPDWPEFIRGCVRYRQSLDTQAAHAPRSAQPYDRRDSTPPPGRACLIAKLPRTF
jgi:hypothetical protein